MGGKIIKINVNFQAQTFQSAGAGNIFMHMDVSVPNTVSISPQTAAQSNIRWMWHTRKQTGTQCIMHGAKSLIQVVWMKI